MLDKENLELDLIRNFIIMLSSITIYNGVNKYKLHKDFNNNKKITIVNPEVIKAKFNTNDKKRLKSLKLGKDILNFKKVLAQNLSCENLNILYNNLKNIKTNEKILFLKNLLLYPVAGTYMPRKNKINVLKIFKDDVINHELFHMASTIYDKEKNMAFVGFAQINYNNKTSIGRGLNEGYTEVLTSKYFNSNPALAYSYKVSKLFASMLEIIVGKEKMQSAYLNADLPSLITELEKYDTKENIISFIKYWDYYLKYNSYRNALFFFPSTKIFARKKINEALKHMQDYLIKWFTIKSKQILDNNIISNEEYETKIVLYSKLITNDHLLKKYKKEY